MGVLLLKATRTRYIGGNGKFSKRIWLNFFPSLDKFFLLCRPSWSPLDHWDGLIACLASDELNVAAIIMWNIWSFRNRVICNRFTADQTQLCRNIEANIKDQDTIENSRSNLLSIRSESLSSHQSWPPLIPLSSS